MDPKVKCSPEEMSIASGHCVDDRGNRPSDFYDREPNRLFSGQCNRCFRLQILPTTTNYVNVVYDPLSYNIASATLNIITNDVIVILCISNSVKRRSRYSRLKANNITQ